MGARGQRSGGMGGASSVRTVGQRSSTIGWRDCRGSDLPCQDRRRVTRLRDRQPGSGHTTHPSRASSHRRECPPSSAVDWLGGISFCRGTDGGTRGPMGVDHAPWFRPAHDWELNQGEPLDRGMALAVGRRPVCLVRRVEESARPSPRLLVVAQALQPPDGTDQRQVGEAYVFEHVPPGHRLDRCTRFNPPLGRTKGARSPSRARARCTHRPSRRSTTPPAVIRALAAVCRRYGEHYRTLRRS
jgi:hypothetical protein